jgi:Domain of unknown function (DUF4783)
MIHQRGYLKEMKRVQKSLYPVLVVLLFLLIAAITRVPDLAIGGVKAQAGSQQASGAQKEDYRRLFAIIQNSLSSGNISAIVQHLAPQVQVNFRGAENGYYSANQTYYLLENYFRSRKIMGFEFTTIGESESNPYATGGANLNFRGTREYAQVYVSLARSGEKWVITQINIY